MLKRLFAQAYGVWDWNISTSEYTPNDSLKWTPPSLLCGGATDTDNPYQLNGRRPDYPSDYCALAPRVTNIKVNGSTVSPLSLGSGSQTAGLQFNVTVDGEQWPLTAYKVDWGDGSVTVVSGVSLRDASNANQPITLYHTYDYYALLKQSTQGSLANPPTCDGGICSVNILIQVKDNWGWCNGNLPMPVSGLGSRWGYYSQDCSSYQAKPNSWQKGPVVEVEQ